MELKGDSFLETRLDEYIKSYICLKWLHKIFEFSFRVCIFFQFFFFFFWKASNEHIFLLEIVTPFLLFKNWKNNVRGGDIGVPKMYIRLLLNIILYWTSSVLIYDHQIVAVSNLLSVMVALSMLYFFFFQTTYASSCILFQDELRQQKEEEIDDYCSQVSYEMNDELMNKIWGYPDMSCISWYMIVRSEKIYSKQNSWPAKYIFLSKRRPFMLSSLYAYW